MPETKLISRYVGQGENPEGRPDSDFYETPRIAIEKLLEVEKFTNPILEPACGAGAISEILKEHNYKVYSSDLHDYGYGESGLDFLDYSIRPFPSVITNPPFSLAEQFIKKGLAVTKSENGKLALLLRLAFLEGQKRKPLFESSPLKSVHVFSKRITFSRPGLNFQSSGMLAYAWYVWDWQYEGKPTISWI